MILYTGMFLLIAASLMAPVLVVSYVRLARRKEREMEARFGEAYCVYRAPARAFWPWFSGRAPGLERQCPPHRGNRSRR